MRQTDILAMAVFALRGNWMRSILTALGVIIGIAAVIIMVSIGQGTQAELDKIMDRLGSNRLEVFPGGGRSGGVSMAAGSLPSLTTGDMTALAAEIPEVQYVAASVRSGGQVVFAERNWSTSWQGISPDFMAVNDWQLAAGDGFQARDYSTAGKVVILGETVRRELFGDGDAIGATVRIQQVPMTVVGVLESKGQTGWGGDADDIAFLPLDTARRRMMGAAASPGAGGGPASLLPMDRVNQITITVARPQDLDYVQEEATRLLRQRHRIAPGAEDDFTVRNLAQMVATRTQTARLMALLLGAVAGISLLVGGIGIMNIMLVSVTERIREIGLRMAIGGGPSSVRRQFLAEALIISIGGGAIGIAIGVGGAIAIAGLTELPVVLNHKVIAMATAFAVATGLFFGYYPASKAAKLDPIEALRQ
ncbi:MAG: ABC transporter permease [Xanthomonadales bacterium]|nr:ABC transporter permease [Xanthomonadales bacterium]